MSRHGEVQIALFVGVGWSGPLDVIWKRVRPRRKEPVGLALSVTPADAQGSSALPVASSPANSVAPNFREWPAIALLTGAAELGSCLTDATPGGRSPANRPWNRRYVAVRTNYATIIAAL
jgi:hypothetical protein